MSKRCTIVTYHYVRDLPNSSHPEIKGLLTSDFENQLNYLERFYKFVTVDDCIEAIHKQSYLPNNAILLTFDDGYIDHYTTVFPILKQRGIQGCFYPPVKPILENEVLDVNKIHFILATVSNVDELIIEIFSLMDAYRNKFSLKSNEYYFNKLAEDRRFDTKEVIFVKRLLQSELNKDLRNQIVDSLFKKHVTDKTKIFAEQLYMNTEQLKSMVIDGMHIGAHSYSHLWMDKLQPLEQEKEIDASISFLQSIGSPIENWTMCYPYGRFNKSLINVLEERNCAFALTTELGISTLNVENALKLNRIDTNDLPKDVNSEPNTWTQKIIDIK